MAVSTALMAAAPSFDGARISRDVKELASDAYEAAARRPLANRRPLPT